MIDEIVITLTLLLGSTLAVQFCGWLWSINVRLFILFVAGVLFAIGSVSMWRSLGDRPLHQSRSSKSLNPDLKEI